MAGDDGHREHIKARTSNEKVTIVAFAKGVSKEKKTETAENGTDEHKG
jgi:hypothetical protein